MKRSLFVIAGLSATAGGLLLVLCVFAGLARPDLTLGLPSYTQEQIAQVEAARNVSFDASDPSKLPTLHVSVDYAEGKRASWWPKDESPVMHELVEQGVYPPVAERVGPEPIVMRGVDGVGNYGGTWLRISTSPNDVRVVDWRMSYSGLFRWSPLGYPIEPHLAKGMTHSDDYKQFTISLRKGVRWSDGEPFTAADIMYWWNCEELDEAIGNGLPPTWLWNGNGQVQLEALDDYTIRFTFKNPVGSFEEIMACYSYLMTASPRHYLSKYHPRLGDPQFIEREMKAYGMPSPRALYTYLKMFQNPEHPRMWPWVYRTYRGTAPQIFVRNPYYYVVDEQGNQLPYIDRLQFDIFAGQILPQAFANGRVSMQTRYVQYDNYTELMSRRASSGMQVYHWYCGSRSIWMINPNVNRIVLPDFPESRWKAQLLRDKRFRQAMSLAIDRRAIIAAEYNNQVEASQVEPGPESPYHSEKLAHAFIEHDPARANALLDELGLTGRDADGMRTFPDGSMMTWYLDYTDFTGIGPAQFVVDDWAVVGVRAIVRARARSLFDMQDAVFDFAVWTSESDHVPLIDARALVPKAATWAWRWSLWYTYGGFYGDPAAAKYDDDSLRPGSPIYEAIAAYELAKQAPALEERQKLLAKVTDIAAEQVWTISIAVAPPQPVIVKDGFKNVPHNAVYSARMLTPGNAGIETYFFEHPDDSPGAVADVRDSLTHITPGPRKGNAPDVASVKSTKPLLPLLRYAFLGIVAMLIVMAAVRHPFIARRLLIMVPTLVIISVVVFTIIQLPPGDYLTSRLIQLRESGDVSAEQEIEDLRRLFHFDDPAWRKYVRWMGLKWFVTFDGEDKGLLQGYMGRSMETTEPVNRMVGDRINLTIAISLATILFTWAVAIPIGVYSAVKQYSVGDYVLTLIGFVGMSAPGFLLAMVLMTIAGLGGGLFSAQFAAQPEWTFAKCIDLMKHIWVPVVVLGVGGTAAMIRIMRANLLDELKKPYVVTARAKGVRPIRLLFKYPVRVAINPFISGIGHYFPQLISGGAIVAIVLALPTVGPLLLASLFSQDMYLAGSMLMVLSTLAVFGTLVSDLLLLWLDPRIRFEGAGQ